MYGIYYAPDTVAMLKPIMDNKDLNLTQEAVDYNAALLSSILSNIKYNVKDIPVLFIEKEGSMSTSEYSSAVFYIAYIDAKGNYQVEAIERNGEIKIRGNSTANKAKNPYNISCKKRSERGVSGPFGCQRGDGRCKSLPGAGEGGFRAPSLNQ